MSSLSLAQAIAHAATGNLTILDVREAAEIHASGLAAGAVHIPLALVPVKAGELTRDKPVAVYCAKGGRAGMAVQTLQGMGFTAHNIGGFGDWVAAGGPVA